MLLQPKSAEDKESKHGPTELKADGDARDLKREMRVTRGQTLRTEKRNWLVLSLELQLQKKSGGKETKSLSGHNKEKGTHDESEP